MAFLVAPRCAPERVAVRYDRDDDTARAPGFNGEEVQARTALRQDNRSEGYRDDDN